MSNETTPGQPPPKAKGKGFVIWILLAVFALAAGALLLRANLHGFSTRGTPSPPERLIASTARRWAVPRAMRDTGNPVPFSSAVWAESRAHFADHFQSAGQVGGAHGVTIAD